jgi:hypothetical protein
LRAISLALVALGFASSALAAPGAHGPTLLATADSPQVSSGLTINAPEQKRKFDIEIGYRGRYMMVPKAILDIWFFDDDAPGWIHSEGRPRISAVSHGFEVVLKSEVEDGKSSGSNAIFYTQWVANRTPGGYFDDREEPPNHTDGDWISPTRNLGLMLMGANYAYELHMVKTAKTNGAFGMSLLVGGGLGAAILVGKMEYWRPEGNITAIERFESGVPKDGNKPIPAVLPVVDINVALRFNIADRVVIRAEGGLQNFLYGGGSVGFMF